MSKVIATFLLLNQNVRNRIFFIDPWGPIVGMYPSAIIFYLGVRSLLEARHWMFFFRIIFACQILTKSAAITLVVPARGLNGR